MFTHAFWRRLIPRHQLIQLTQFLVMVCAYCCEITTAKQRLTVPPEINDSQLYLFRRDT